MSTSGRTIASLALGGAALGVLAPAVSGQALLDRRPVTPQRAPGEPYVPVATDGTRSIDEVSITAVEPPPPRTFAENDLVTIIISERARIDRSHSVETEKEYEMRGAINSIPELLKLLELRIEQADEDSLPSIDLEYEREFEGDGEVERDDAVTARVTARVLEVKPNGTLLLESKTRVRTDDEEQLIVLSGICRPEDVTISNTIQSNQLYDLVVDIQHEGEIKRNATKGFIPKFLEAIFNF